jgi:riboflavin synthase
MFTGIVEEPGRVETVTATDDGHRLTIAGEEVVADLSHGDSIAVNGVCLTVEDNGDEPSGHRFEAFLSAETLAKTTLGAVGEGDLVNLERPMPADGRFDGHVVQGHVDTTTEVVGVEQVGERDARSASNGPSGEQPRGGWVYEFALPEGYEQYVVGKGSITLDGISLTVAELRDETFTAAIIPSTRELTNLSDIEPGDRVNVEVDVIAKYVERML